MLPCTYNHCASLLCRANNWRALLLCRAPISTAHSFGSCTITCCAQFLYRTLIFHAFHSTRCTMPKFSMPPPRTNTLRAPLTKLSRDNIYPHCARTNQTPLRSANTAHHAPLLCVCTPCNAPYCICVCTPHAHQHLHVQC
jgi:hypothetical protein